MLRYAFHYDGRRGRAARREAVGDAQVVDCRIEVCFVVVVDHQTRFALFDLCAHFLDFGYADIRVDFPAFGCCENLHCARNHTRIDVVDVPAFGGGQFAYVFGHRVLGGVFEPRGGAALRLYHFDKLFDKYLRNHI